MLLRKMSTMIPPDISGPSVVSRRPISIGQAGSTQRSLVAEDPESERIPARIACAAFSLFALGLILLCMSVNFFSKGHPGSLAFLLLGIVVLIPGAYSSFQLLAAFRRWPGYDLEDLQARGDFV